MLAFPKALNCKLIHTSLARIGVILGDKVTRVLHALVVRNVSKYAVLAIMTSVFASPAGAGRHAISVHASLHAVSTVVACMASASVKMDGAQDWRCPPELSMRTGSRTTRIKLTGIQIGESALGRSTGTTSHPS